jgi:CheY-like chemotaxis protein
MSGTVLIVDDDVNARIIAETLLRLRGLQVRRADDGAEACECVRREDIAVIVLELQLPGMNGFDVLRRLRSPSGPLQAPTAPRILAVTHRQEPELERFVRRLGADAFLQKPVAPGRFIRTVEELLASSAPRAA